MNLESFIALDFETTGLDSNNDRIIEVAAIKFKKGIIKDKYVQLINPEIKIPKFITKITGIKNNMVKTAPNEEMVIDDLLYFLGNDPVVGHNINFDVRFLKSLCSRLGRDTSNNLKYDTLQLARCVLFDQPVFNLSALADYYGFSSKGAHRAEIDTYNTGNIFLELIEELSSFPLEIISRIESLLKNTNIPNKYLYRSLSIELSKIGSTVIGLTKSKIKREFCSNYYFNRGKNDIDNCDVIDIFGKEGSLSKSIENFEYRPNQLKYAEASNQILSMETGVGILEAGTGLGKSMAYLYAAIYQSLIAEDEGPIIIACHTKNLQDQLFNKDLPKLTKSMDISLKAVILKGRRNYLCKTRLDWITSDQNMLNDDDINALLPIFFWLEFTKTGDLSECSGFFNARREWLKTIICCEPGFCTSEICSKNDGCYFGKLKKLLYGSNIIVVNHSLLMLETLKPGSFPDYNYVIVDEAHNLIKSAYDNFKINWSEQEALSILKTIDPSSPRSSRWNKSLKDLGEKYNEIKTLSSDLKEAVEKAKINITNFMASFTDYNHNQFDSFKTYQNKPIIDNIGDFYKDMMEEVDYLIKTIKRLLFILDRIRYSILEIDNTKKFFKTLYSTIENACVSIKMMHEKIVFLTSNHNKKSVYWIEGDFKNKNTIKEKLILSIHSSLVDVSDEMYNVFFKKTRNVLLTSATLQVNNSFDYFKERLGINQLSNVVIEEFKSPFHYPEQVTFYQYNGSVEISNDFKKIGELIIAVHKKLSKRTLVLFTSTKTLANTYDYIKDKNYKIPIFAQLRGFSKSALLKGMSQNANGILLGTNSFWEGVDFPGDLLEVLILVKLPFDVPSDPLVKSYSELLNGKGQNSFIEYSIPECVMRFRQGFGRLIRTTYDSGVFICLDNRVVLKRYGNIISKSIPVEMKPFSNFDSIN